MKVRAFDIRYNLEFVGFKRGVGRHNYERKIYLLKNYSKAEIQNYISSNGCPGDMNGFTSQRFVNDCNKAGHNCITCWKQEAEE